MIRRILAALDGSSRSERILPAVGALAARRGAEIVLLRAVPRGGRGREEAERRLGRCSARLRSRGLRARARVVEGRPADAILEASEREGADLVALATRARSGLARRVLGSVAETLFLEGRRPLLLVRSDGSKGGLGGGVRRILLPSDGGESSLQAVPSALELARLFGAEILVLYVEEKTRAASESHVPSGILVGPRAVPGGLPTPPPPRQPARVAESVVAWIGPQDVRLSPASVVGDAGNEIRGLQESRSVDLVVMAARARRGRGRRSLGGLAEAVLRSSVVPLVLLRAPDGAGGAA